MRKCGCSCRRGWCHRTVFSAGLLHISGTERNPETLRRSVLSCGECFSATEIFVARCPSCLGLSLLWLVLSPCFSCLGGTEHISSALTRSICAQWYRRAYHGEGLEMRHAWFFTVIGDMVSFQFRFSLACPTLTFKTTLATRDWISVHLHESHSPMQSAEKVKL